MVKFLPTWEDCEHVEVHKYAFTVDANPDSEGRFEFRLNKYYKIPQTVQLINSKLNSGQCAADTTVCEAQETQTDAVTMETVEVLVSMGNR